MPWVPRLLDLDENKHAFLSYESLPGETVRQLLSRIADQYPKLGEMLIDAERKGLKMPIEVVVNGSVLGIHHHLDSELKPGDEVLLLPQYQGG